MPIAILNDKLRKMDGRRLGLALHATGHLALANAARAHGISPHCPSQGRLFVEAGVMRDGDFALKQAFENQIPIIYFLGIPVGR